MSGQCREPPNRLCRPRRNWVARIGVHRQHTPSVSASNAGFSLSLFLAPGEERSKFLIGAAGFEPATPCSKAGALPAAPRPVVHKDRMPAARVRPAMADVQPLRALHYSPFVGPLSDVVSALRRDRRRPARALIGAHRSTSSPSTSRRTSRIRRGRRRAVGGLAASGRARARSRAGPLGSHAGLHGARRADAHPPGSSAACVSRATVPAGTRDERIHPGPRDRLRLMRANTPTSPPPSCCSQPRRRRLDGARAGNRRTHSWARSPTRKAPCRGRGA